ncbi:MAG TPA: hypothetical protein VFL92_01400 [Sphingomonas sp.]|nr:hypothetical protein [Sphingomonas sp.]
MKMLSSALLGAAVLTAPLAIQPAAARPHQHHDWGWHGDRNGKWDPSQHYHRGNYRARRLGRNDRVYRGSDGRYYCRRSDGTTGLVLGALGGGLAGNLLGGGTLGTLLGAGGGALLGRSIDRGHITCR